MRHVLCAVAVLVAIASGCNARREAIHYIGRFTDEAQPRFAWPGSGVVARFSGTGIAVKLGGAPNWFDAFVDGEPVATIQVGPTGSSASAYTIAAGLPAGMHTVEVYRRTEALFEPSTFGGFEVTGGALRKSRYPFAQRLLFVGDSITTGYGNHGTLASDCHLELETQNVMDGYAMLTARALNAGAHVIAWSGKGMYRQFHDRATPSPGQMPELFERTLPGDAGSAWKHGRFRPDVVVVNLGTNDWAGGDPGEPFVTAYTAFLQRLRALYPRAEIFCMLAPMRVEPGAVKHVTDALSRVGDAHMRYVEMPGIDPADGYGCDSHPSIATHRKMAEALVAQIRGVMHW